MRRVRVHYSDGFDRKVRRVTDLDLLASEWTPELSFAVLVRSEDDQVQVARLKASGLSNIQWVSGGELQIGDIVVPSANASEVLVLHRDGDLHHALQLTNQCNSLCLMCSQPPTRHDDSWMIVEALDTIRHFRVSPDCIGLSGGEPLLLREGLRTVLDTLTMLHPSTRIEILTNGRMLAEASLAHHLLHQLSGNLTWLVPLYGHADFLHDFVVQTPGAFEETIAGLLNLQKNRQPVQLRIVLIEPVLTILPDLCAFIGRNLPFVHEVALMACEPIGFALANRDLCQVDLRDAAPVIERSVKMLTRYDVPYVLMNTPLCALPRSLWGAASRSISDWKNAYSEVCDPCTVRKQCSGLFAWHEAGWAPTTLQPVLEIGE